MAQTSRKPRPGALPWRRSVLFSIRVQLRRHCSRCVVPTAAAPEMRRSLHALCILKTSLEKPHQACDVHAVFRAASKSGPAEDWTGGGHVGTCPHCQQNTPEEITTHAVVMQSMALLRRGAKLCPAVAATTLWSFTRIFLQPMSGHRDRKQDVFTQHEVLHGAVAPDMARPYHW